MSKNSGRKWTIDICQLKSSFVSLFNHLRVASRLPPSCDYMLFKSSILPCWEDPQNSGGGRWVLYFSKPEQVYLNLDVCWLASVNGDCLSFLVRMKFLFYVDVSINWWSICSRYQLCQWCCTFRTKKLWSYRSLDISTSWSTTDLSYRVNDQWIIVLNQWISFLLDDVYVN